MHSIKTTTFDWGQDSAVAHLESRKSIEGTRFLRLTAKEGLPRSALGEVTDELKALGFRNVYADAPGGKPMLVISGVHRGDTAKLIAFLNEHHYTQGEAKIEHSEDKSQTETFAGWLQRNSLKASGVAGLTGQVAFGLGSKIAGNKSGMVAAGIGTGMELANATFGNGADNVDIGGMVHGFVNYAKSQGIEVAEPGTKEFDNSWGHSVKYFIGKHSFPIVQGIGLYGGVKTFQSGLETKNPGMMGMASINMLGKGVTLGVPEKNAEERRIELDEEAKKSGKENEPRSTVSQFFHGLGGTLKTLVTNPGQFPTAMKNFAQSNPMGIDGAFRVTENVAALPLMAITQVHQINHEWGNRAEEIASKKKLVEAYRDPRKAANIQNELQEEQTTLEEAKKKLPALGKEADAELKLQHAALDRKIKQIASDKKLVGELHNNEGKIEPSFFKKITFRGKVGDHTERNALADKVESQIGVMEKQVEIARSRPMLAQTAKVLPWVQTVAWFSSSALSMISSKNSSMRPEDNPAFDRLYAITAEMVNAMPKEEREPALQHMADYYTTCPQLRELGVTTKLFETLVRKRIDALENSPWVASSAQEATLAANERPAKSFVDRVQPANDPGHASVIARPPLDPAMRQVPAAGKGFALKLQEQANTHLHDSAQGIA